jgi:hypothetical protein
MSAACYTGPVVRALLNMPPRTFARALKNGELPFLEELQPRTKPRRYKKEPVDRYLRGEWGAPRLVFGRRSAR